MKWLILNNVQQIEDLLLQERIVVIFKHSIRCAISKGILNNFEKKFNTITEIIFCYLNIINYREISNLLVKKFEVVHQSPQIIVLKKGKLLAYYSHYSIIADFNLEVCK